MTTWINVVRYHLSDWLSYLFIPWGALAFSFAINLIIFAAVGPRPGGHASGGVATFYAFMFVGGLVSVTRSLPFGLALGLSRRTYYLGTGLLAVTLGVVNGLLLAILQVVERATGGWGERLKYFRVPWLLNGPWYVTWLTSFVGLTLLFVYGIWFGLVFRRWGLIGLLGFIAGQITVLVVPALIVTRTHTWHNVGHFFASLNPEGLTGLLAVLTAALLLGGFATMRRVTV